MGWTISYKPETREQCLERIAPLAGWTSEAGLRITFTREKWTAEGCWGILTATNPDGTIRDRMICFARIERRGAGYGEGGLWPEYTGPYHEGCPKHLLDVTPIFGDGQPGYSADFRRRNSAA